MRPWFQKKRFIIPIAFLVLGGISSALGGAESESPASAQQSSQTDSGESEATSEETIVEETNEDLAKIGDEVADGSFAFVVRDFECGIQSVGGEFLNAEAQGQYCRVGVSVLNIGDEAQYMFSDNQYIYDNQGRKFTADSMASMYANDGDDIWMNELNPGLQLDGDLYFDVPQDAQIVSIELHDSMFSGGVSVSLK